MYLFCRSRISSVAYLFLREGARSAYRIVSRGARIVLYQEGVRIVLYWEGACRRIVLCTLLLARGSAYVARISYSWTLVYIICNSSTRFSQDWRYQRTRMGKYQTGMKHANIISIPRVKGRHSGMMTKCIINIGNLSPTERIVKVGIRSNSGFELVWRDEIVRHSEQP